MKRKILKGRFIKSQNVLAWWIAYLCSCAFNSGCGVSAFAGKH